MESLVNPSDLLPHLELDPRSEKTVVSVKHLLNHIPDLQLFKHPHKSNSVCFASTKGINGTEQVEFYVRPGKQQVIEAWVYSIIEGHQVYSIPQYYELGTSVEYGFGYSIDRSVLDRLDAAGVKFSVRRDVALYMASKEAISYRADA